MTWPTTATELEAAQREIASLEVEPWQPPAGPLIIGGCFVCFQRGVSGAGHAGEPAWAAAVSMSGTRIEASAVIDGVSGAPYEPGLLALREGALLDAAVRALPSMPDVLLVNATGRDHPRRCGLALHLGAVLGVPTVGVTHRPLLASGAWPPEETGATAPLLLDGDLRGYWLRTRRGKRPLAVHAAWRSTPEVALDVVLRALVASRTPEPLRQARRLARAARDEARLQQ